MTTPRPWGKSGWSAKETRIRLETQHRESPMFVPEESLDDDDLSEISSETVMSTFLRPRSEHPRKVTRGVSSSTVTMSSSLPSAVVSPQSKPQSPVRIKSEAETEAVAELQLKPPRERVKIYVGPNNTICEVGLKDLDKSPVLKSLVNSTDIANPFIMHPELALIKADDFHSVREFLLTDEYMPAMLDNPKGQDILPKRLGECATEVDYRREAIRGARLYLIAKQLAMNTMQDLVFRKISTAQYQEYGIECLLEMAKIIFSRPKESVLVGKGKCRAHDEDSGSDGTTDGKGDPLEEWLIQMLGDQLKKVMTKHAKQFFDVAEHAVCAARGFGLRVLKWKVEFWEAVGHDVIAIEDDD